jgi:hypothetical protein
MRALAGKPGRSLCQYIALRLQAPNIFTKPLQLLAFVGRQYAGLRLLTHLPVGLKHRLSSVRQVLQSTRLLHPAIGLDNKLPKKWAIPSMDPRTV